MLKRVVCVVVLLAPSAAFAQILAGPYVSGDIGASIPTGSMRSSQSTTKIDLDDGLAGDLGAGWRFRDGVRVELDGNYERNGVQDVLTPSATTGQLSPVKSLEGSASTYAVTANVLYDLPVRWWVQPYVGVGAGYGWLNFNGVGGVGYGALHIADDNTVIGNHTVQFGTAGAFAYQARAGLSLPIRSVPGLTLTADYRFFGTARADVPVSRVAIGAGLFNGAVAANYNHYGLHAANNILSLGFRYNFGSY